MKIAEYIELVKQAELVNTTSEGNLIPLSNLSTDNLTPEEQRVVNFGREAIRTQGSQRPITTTNPTKAPQQNPSVGSGIPAPEPVRLSGAPQLPHTPVKDPYTGMLRQPRTPEYYGVHLGHLDGTPGIFSRISPNLSFLDGVYVEPLKLDSLFPETKGPVSGEYKPIIDPRTGQVMYNPRAAGGFSRIGKNIAKSIVNTPLELLNSLNAPVRFVDTSRLGATFSLLAPVEMASREAELKAYDILREQGYTPSDNIRLPFGFEVSPDVGAYLPYYNNLLQGSVAYAPQVVNTWASFSSPASPVAIASDFGINFPYKLLTGSDKDLLPGFWHPTGRPTKFRSNEDYEEEEGAMSQLGELLPDIFRTNDKLYSRGNLLADSAGSWLDPVAQLPFGLFYGKIMPSVANFMGRPNAVHTDEYGNTTVDYRDLFSNIFGSKGVYEQEGGRPELRNLPEHEVYWHLNRLREAAARMGYTRDEIDRATVLYANPNSLLYKGANALTFMGMPAKDIYGSVYMGELPTEPSADIPRYLPYNGGPDPVLKDHPEWLEENKRVLRQLADQETLFRMNPFFQDIRGYESQMTPEEEEFLGNPDNLAKLDELPIDNIIRQVTPNDVPNVEYIDNVRESLENRAYALLPYILQGWDPATANIDDPEKFDGVIANLMRQQSEMTNVLEIPSHPVGVLGDPDESLITGWNDANEKYNKIYAEYYKNYYTNRIARLPYQYRYAYLKANPQFIPAFLDRYYTNEETKKRICQFLGVPTPEELQTTKPVGTLTSIIAPSLLKARQQARVQQQINDAM